MRDRSKEIAMLEDTLKILKQGWYEKKWQKDTAETFRKRNAGTLSYCARSISVITMPSAPISVFRLTISSI